MRAREGRIVLDKRWVRKQFHLKAAVIFASFMIKLFSFVSNVTLGVDNFSMLWIQIAY